jgi:DnaK suppressor protein
MTTAPRALEAPRPVHLADHLSEFHAALRQQRRFRLDQLHQLAEAAATASPADDVRDEVSEILRSSAATALAEVEAALERLRAGTYGSCERCTTHIPYPRLEILPMSRYCMRCQHTLEMRSA